MTDVFKDAVESAGPDAHIRVEPLVEPDGSPLFILHTDGDPFVMDCSGIARIPMGEVLAIREDCTPLNTPSPVSDGLPDGETATFVYDADTGHHKELIGADGGALPA